MSKKKNNTGKGKGKKALALLKDLETKGNAKNTLIETGKSLVAGIVGAGIGAAIGKPSLGVGLLTTGVGHYKDSGILTSLGVGMIASGGYQIGEGAVSGSQVSGLEGVKERLKAFGENVKQKLYLDKIIKAKSGTNGVGEVQYFKYPQNELDMGSLDNIENEITKSGEAFEQKRNPSSEDDFRGFEDKIF